MYKRRRQAASPVSLLVVTLLSVWACSSGGHGDTSVTTSGGAGSSLGLGSASSASSPGVSASGEGGASGSESAASSDAAGAAGESQSHGAKPAAEGGSGGVDSVDGSGLDEAGAAGASVSVGGASGGAPSNGGSGGHGGGAAGAPFVAPVCAPTDASSTDTSVTLYLPCEANSALFVCRTCHTNPPSKPTNTSYVTYADFKNRAGAVYDVVRTGYMPRAPYHMSVTQQQTAMKWLGQDGSCAIGVPTPCQ